MDDVLRSLINGLLLGGVYAVIVLGVVVVFKATKIFNLAHGGILLFFSYFMWWLMASVGFSLWVALIVFFPAVILFGLVIDRILMRRMIGQSMLSTFIVTLVVGFTIVQGITILVWGGAPQVMPRIFPSGNVHFGEVTFSYTWLFAFVAAALMFLIFVSYFRFTRTGLAMRCVSEDNVVSQSLGIDVKRIFAISWVVASLSAAIGGVLLASLFTVDTGIGSFAMMRALPVMLLGGVESVPGAFVGALIIGVAETMAGTYVDPHVRGFRELLPYILMVVILFIRPQGLFGLKEIRRI